MTSSQDIEYACRFNYSQIQNIILTCVAILDCGEQIVFYTGRKIINVMLQGYKLSKVENVDF